MSHKNIRNVALFLILVFAVTIIVYPLIFGTDPHPKAEPPVELQIKR